MQSMHIESIDDLTGEKAQETVHFEIDGTRYEIDLTAKNAAQLRSTLSGYIKKSRTTASRSAHQRRQYGYTVDQDKRERLKRFRRWARANGYNPGEHGPIPSAIVDAYNNAHTN